MRNFYVVMLVLSLLVACALAQAETIYLITFDHGVMDCGPADYTAAGNEILPTDVHGVLLNCGQDPDATRRTGNLVDPNVPGPQGGQVLNMMLAGVWPNKQGYYFGRDPVANGSNYGTHTYPGSPLDCPDPIGSAGPVIANEYTIEALVRPDYTPNPSMSDLTEVSVIFDSVRLDWDEFGASYGGASLAVDQNTGILSYGTGQPYAPFNGITSTTTLTAGQWYHIAAVARKGATQRTELWINGVMDGAGGYPATWETQGIFRLPGYFTIGTQYWPMSERNWQGQIDAIAISDTALDPTSWVIGPHIEPTTIPDAKKLPNDVGVSCAGIVTASFAGYGGGSEYFYIEDPNRCCGIRVAKVGYYAVPGNTATVSGIIVTLPSGERQITASTVLEAPGTALTPVAMTNKSLGGGNLATPPTGQSGVTGASGLNNIGLLVKTTGVVSDGGILDPNMFTLNDGSGVLVHVFVPSGLLPDDGSYIDLTGIGSCEMWEGNIVRFIIATDYQSVL